MMYRVALSIGLASALSLSSAGCGLLLDSEGSPDSSVLPEADSGSGMDGGPGEAGRADAGPVDAAPDTLLGMADAGPVDPEDPTEQNDTCADLPPTTTCHTGATVPRQICIEGDCVASLCGDGLVDTDGGEQCDDENEYNFDGCGNDCQFNCMMPGDCDDGRQCNGEEQCIDHACVQGSLPEVGDPCFDASGILGNCTGAGYCAVLGGLCGDGRLDPGEDCDVLGAAPGSGCEPDCTFTCETDLDCATAGAVTTNACFPTVCNPDHRCQMTSLVPDVACYNDEDGDGFGTGPASMFCSTVCPPDMTPFDGDCDDSDVRAHPGTRLFYAEQSNGGGWDFDCNGADVRFGGFRAHSACTLSAAGRCTGGGWESSRPACGSEATYVTCRAADECMAVRHSVRVRCR
ncbi:MAG: hypothetical protein DRJ42_28070 [Deltaproteobacteria bacterium]|nr:MAG: hypothetical protein DRJ42_28070 [Deltaproteobacteria bacterium]